MSAPVLVTGATGQQGGATTRALLENGIPVRALVRDASTERAKNVAALGAELVTGDLKDRDSLVAAAREVRAVFSVQMPEVKNGAHDFAGELDLAVNLIEAAQTAGVRQFVHTSVSGSDRLASAPGYETGRWKALEPYYASKAGIEKRVREAGFPFWTLLKPAFFMENFRLEASYLLPRGVAGGIVTVLKPATHLSLVAVHDIGVAAAAAIADPERFHEVVLELASDYQPMTAIAETLGRALGAPLAAPDMTEAEALEKGMPAYAALPMELMNLAGQPARPEFARKLGIPLTSFEEWTHRGRIG